MTLAHIKLRDAVAMTAGCHAGGASTVSAAIAAALVRGYGDKASTVAGAIMADVHAIERNPARKAAIMGPSA